MKNIGYHYYNAFMYPFERILLGKLRKNLIARAKGRILEIGVGTGVNLKYYNYDKVDSLTLIDKKINVDEKTITNELVKVIEADVMKLPFESSTFDTVVFTLVFCSVPEPIMGMREILRVLKDDGTLLFIEHVVPEGKVARKFANSANRTWHSISSGCNVNRETDKIIKQSGFSINHSEFSRNGVFISGTAKKEGYSPSL